MNYSSEHTRKNGALSKLLFKIWEDMRKNTGNMGLYEGKKGVSDGK
jgi:hypothetical protein